MITRATSQLLLRVAPAIFALCFSATLLGQAVTGTIVGNVADPSGAVLPNAKVTIVLTGQGTTYTAVTNDSGNFTLPNMAPRSQSRSMICGALHAS